MQAAAIMYHITVFYNSHVITMTALSHLWQHTNTTECSGYTISHLTKFSSLPLCRHYRKKLSRKCNGSVTAIKAMLEKYHLYFVTKQNSFTTTTSTS